jgi:hypothetical protein
MSKLKDRCVAEQIPEPKTKVQEIKDVKPVTQDPEQDQRELGKFPDKSPGKNPGISR